MSPATQQITKNKAAEFALTGCKTATGNAQRTGQQQKESKHEVDFGKESC